MLCLYVESVFRGLQEVNGEKRDIVRPSPAPGQYFRFSPFRKRSWTCGAGLAVSFWTFSLSFSWVWSRARSFAAP